MFSISYTTGFHRDLQVLNMFFYMFSWLGLAYLGEVYIKLYSETFSLILSIVLSAGIIAYLEIKFIYPIINPLAAFLYLRLPLRTKVNFAEAKKLSFLFSGEMGKWYPLEIVRNLPKEKRREYVFNFARQFPFYFREKRR